MAANQNLFTRDDTFFGVCEALGEDTRIPANLFRLALAPLLMFFPLATVVGYLAVGCVIALVRLAIPNRRRTLTGAPAQVTEAAPAADRIEYAAAA